MLVARSIRRVRVWSRTRERADTFATRESKRHGIGIEVAPIAKEAVDGADLVCTTTSSGQPVLLGEWLMPGAHVNAIGAVGPENRELDSDAIARARVYVDRRESADNEAGEIIQARQEGAIGEGHVVAEIGEVIAGTAPGRGDDEEITVFRGLGLAIEDLAAARFVYQRAIEA